MSVATSAGEAWIYVTVELVAVAALCWFAIGRTDLGLTRSVLGSGTTWKRTLEFGVLATLSGVVIGNIVLAVGAPAHFPSRDGVEYLPLSILAGPTEELVVAAMIVLMQRARWHMIAIYAIIITLRVTYHLYYGWPLALSLAVWAGGFVWLFLRYRNVAALAAAHTAHNMIGWLLDIVR